MSLQSSPFLLSRHLLKLTIIIAVIAATAGTATAGTVIVATATAGTVITITGAMRSLVIVHLPGRSALLGIMAAVR